MTQPKNIIKENLDGHLYSSFNGVITGQKNAWFNLLSIYNPETNNVPLYVYHICSGVVFSDKKISIRLGLYNSSDILSGPTNNVSKIQLNTKANSLQSQSIITSSGNELNIPNLKNFDYVSVADKQSNIKQEFPEYIILQPGTGLSVQYFMEDDNKNLYSCIRWIEN